MENIANKIYEDKRLLEKFIAIMEYVSKESIRNPFFLAFGDKNILKTFASS